MSDFNEQKIPQQLASYYLTQTIVETISMRDQFAMAALTGLISRAPDFMFPDLPQKAYRFADDMLEARKEKK